MANTRQIRQRINAAQNISKITKAMEMVSASKMKRAQDQALAARPYARALAASLRTLGSATTADLHPLLAEHDEGIDLAIVLSTDRGLAGSLNANLFKALHEWTKRHPSHEVIMVGKKGVAYSKLVGLPMHAQFIEMPNTISTSDIIPLTSLLIEGFISKRFRSVQVIYMDFINTLSQKVRQTQLLPLTSLAEAAQELPGPPVSVELKGEYIFEPSPRAILDELLPYYIENVVYQAFLESRASEHSARMVAMKNASENARDLVKELRLVYNKSRQASITNELLDITTAMLSLSN